MCARTFGKIGGGIMKSEQVLSVEQMKHLQELGLDTSDASMVFQRGSATRHEWVLHVMGYADVSLREKEFTYTLQDILDKLPESVRVYDLYIFKKVGLWWLKYVDVTNNGTVRLEKMPRLIDAAYYMLCWCIQKGYVKTKE